MRISDWSSDVCSSDLILPDRQFGDLIDEAAHDGQRDIGLDQRDSHFAHRGAHVGLGQRAATAQLSENIAKPIAQTVEHLAFIPLSHLPTPTTTVTETSTSSPTRGQNLRLASLTYPDRKKTR